MGINLEYTKNDLEIIDRIITCTQEILERDRKGIVYKVTINDGEGRYGKK